MVQIVRGEDSPHFQTFYIFKYDNMKSIKFFIGLFDKDTKLQDISTIEAYKQVTKLVCRHFGGWTITDWRGVYTHTNGEQVIEPSLVVYVNTDKDTAPFISEVKKVLNQESVMKEVTLSSVSFE